MPTVNNNSPNSQHIWLDPIMSVFDMKFLISDHKKNHILCLWRHIYLKQFFYLFFIQWRIEMSFYSSLTLSLSIYSPNSFSILSKTLLFNDNSFTSSSGRNLNRFDSYVALALCSARSVIATHKQYFLWLLRSVSVSDSQLKTTFSYIFKHWVCTQFEA